MSRYCFHFFAVMLLTILGSDIGQAQQQFQFATDNFVVVAPDPAFARKVGNEAERFRRELAVEWIGKELPRWSEKCPIQVSLAAHAGGETSFAFMFNGDQRGEPTGWDMKIFGTPERLLDSVLPHEVTHTIFATHFRRPLPRWADEGACTTVEHYAEKKKNHGMLIHFLTSKPSRGIPFNRMFTMKDYPQDILPLYAQGYSVAKYLIMEKGRRHFLDYVNAGMEMEQRGRELDAWNRATKQYYGYENLSDLQVRWERWVAEGSVEREIPANNGDRLASLRPDAPVDSGPNTLRAPRSEVNEFTNRDRVMKPRRVMASNTQPEGRLESMNEGWYAKQMKVGRSQMDSGKRADSRSATQAETIWR